MATRTVVCPECGTEVPYGRLSCAACGTLLASVAGATRRHVAYGSSPEGEAAASVSSPGDAVDAAAASSRRAHRAAAGSAPEREDGPPVPPVLHEWTGPIPPGVGASEDDAAISPANPMSARPEPAPIGRPRGARSMEPLPSEDDKELSMLAEPDGEPDWPAPPATVPGGYVAPNIVPTAATINGRPATATSIAAASIAEGTVTSVPAAPRPTRWFSTPDPSQGPAAAPGAPATPGKAGLFSDLPFRTPKDAAGWALAVGALIGAVAFLLPWAANGVIGAQNEATYTGRWGLANPVGLIPFAAAIALLLLSLIPNPIPASIRGVVLPIVVGGWFLGMAWIYATSIFGLGLGVDALAVGGLLLVFGGAVTQWQADAAAAESDTDAGSA